MRTNRIKLNVIMLRLIFCRTFCNSRCEGFMFLFPGQGSQYAGMTKSVSHLPEVQKLYNVASAVLGFDARSLCLNGPQATLDETVYCQPAVVLASLAAVEHLKLKSPEVVELRIEIDLHVSGLERRYFSVSQPLSPPACRSLLDVRLQLGLVLVS